MLYINIYSHDHLKCLTIIRLTSSSDSLFSVFEHSNFTIIEVTLENVLYNVWMHRRYPDGGVVCNCDIKH